MANKQAINQFIRDPTNLPDPNLMSVSLTIFSFNEK